MKHIKRNNCNIFSMNTWSQWNDGNELADQEAYKAASSINTQTLNLSIFTDLKNLLKIFYIKKWQNYRTKQKKNKKNIQVGMAKSQPKRKR